MRKLATPRWGWWMGWLLTGWVGASVAWGSTWTLHDNFEASARIEPNKWFGSESRQPSSIREASRYVADGKLQLSAVGYGGNQASTGRRTASFGLGLRTPPPITAIQAELTVTNAVAEACSDNEHATQGRAQLVSSFFIHEGSGKRGDLTGHVVALLEKVVDSRDGNFIRALALRCVSWSCGQGKLIKSLLFKRTWRLHEADIFRIEWEPSAHHLMFSVNPGSADKETHRIPYDKAMTPLKAPKQQRQRVRIRHHGANCKAGRRGVLMHVAVDDVYLQLWDAKRTAAFSKPEQAPKLRRDDKPGVSAPPLGW